MTTPLKSRCADMPTEKAQIVPVTEYPAMLDEKAAAEFVRVMASKDTSKRMNTTIDQRRGEISGAVRRYIEELSAAATAGDLKSVFDRAHDIRGLAGTGGLDAAGKIADGLCKYIDAIERLGATAETPVIALHIDAIARAASTSAEAQKHGPQVAAELGALVEHKLNAINESKTKAAGGR